MIPLPIRPAGKIQRWARHIDRATDGHLCCPCCRLAFGADETFAASWHVVYGHPAPDDVDEALMDPRLSDAERQVLEHVRIERMTPAERAALEQEAAALEAEADEIRRLT